MYIRIINTFLDSKYFEICNVGEIIKVSRFRLKRMYKNIKKLKETYPEFENTVFFEVLDENKYVFSRPRYKILENKEK